MSLKKETQKNIFIVLIFIALLLVIAVISFSIPSPQISSALYHEEQIEGADVYFMDDYQYGTNPNASVHIIMFGDYQCPYTADSVPAINQLLVNYGDRINFIYKHMPNFQIHKQAVLASLAAECAREQGKFWGYSQELFKQSSNLFYDNLLEIAEGLGLDSAQFKGCMSTKKYAEKIKADLQDVMELKLLGTPVVFINNMMFQGVYDFADYDRYIKEELSK